MKKRGTHIISYSRLIINLGSLNIQTSNQKEIRYRFLLREHGNGHLEELQKSNKSTLKKAL